MLLSPVRSLGETMAVPATYGYNPLGNVGASMKMLFLSAVALVLAPQAAAQDGYQPPWLVEDDLIAWQIEHIDIAPRDIVWSDRDTLSVMDRSSLVRNGNITRAWFRWDALSPDTPFVEFGRSVLLLREADCVDRKARVIAMTFYSGNNLTGTNSSADSDEAGWTYDRPGFLGAAQTAAACEGEFMISDEQAFEIMRELQAE